MPRSRHAVMVTIATLALSGCGTSANRAPVPDAAAVVEQSPPEPTCPPADITSTTPPEPVANYRDGATYTC